MIVRFCLYSILKNLRFFDPFLALYLLDAGFTYAEVGSMLGCQKLVTAVLEIPSGVIADRWGRRRTLISSFTLHAIGLLVLAFGSQSGSHPNPLWFFVGLCIFGGGEALREGCHKAIMLDYLEYRGEISQATHVLSVTRMFSKTSSALAGLIAGGLLYVFHEYSVLFWLSAAAAAGGAILMMTYPKYLEGEIHREQAADVKSVLAAEGKILSMLRNMRMWPVVLRSAIYECQVDIITDLFLQPFLREGLGSAGIAMTPASGLSSVRGTGSLVVGANELFRDGLGAVGARSSAKFETAAGGQARALRILYAATVVAIALIGLCAIRVQSFFWPGLVLIGLVTLFQNLRRPVYVSALNDVANKPLRATILSIDNQAISVGTAILMPLMGLIADRWGLWTICAISTTILLLGTFIRPRIVDP